MSADAGAHILVLGAGSGVLALMAARAGAGRVTAVERSRMQYRMARQALDANLDAPGAANIRIVDCQLRGVGVQGAACVTLMTSGRLQEAQQ